MEGAEECTLKSTREAAHEPNQGRWVSWLPSLEPLFSSISPRLRSIVHLDLFSCHIFVSSFRAIDPSVTLPPALSVWFESYACIVRLWVLTVGEISLYEVSRLEHGFRCGSTLLKRLFAEYWMRCASEVEEQTTPNRSWCKATKNVFPPYLISSFHSSLQRHHTLGFSIFSQEQELPFFFLSVQLQYSMKILTVLIALLGAATAAVLPENSLADIAKPWSLDCPEPDDWFLQTSQQLAIEASASQTDAPMTWEEEHIQIGTWVHVMTSNAPQYGDVPELDINDMMSRINQAFINTSFQFELLGFNQTVDPKLAVYRDKDGFKLGPLAKGDYTTLNLFIVEERDGIAASVMPTKGHSKNNDDGCCFVSSLLENGDPTGLGAVVHEIGHWLGLAHTFQEGGKDCSGPDNDYVEDTPKHLNPMGHPEYYTCGALSTCGKTDPVNNYMNYMSYGCYKEFTPGQIVRMKQWWDFRKKIASGD